MPGEAEPLSHDMIILYVTVMLVRTLIIVYFCPCVSVQGLFTGRVGTSNQLGIAGFGAGCILGECLHGNASQFCVCVRVFFFQLSPFCSFIYLYSSRTGLAASQGRRLYNVSYITYTLGSTLRTV